ASLWNRSLAADLQRLLPSQTATSLIRSSNLTLLNSGKLQTPISFNELIPTSTWPQKIMEIEILREFMHRLEMDTGTQRRPSLLDQALIMNRVLAILLGVLGMDLEEAATTFVQLCTAVFPKD
ncbi:11950_t:CDS:2, partial [Acaulospora colombiana]